MAARPLHRPPGARSRGRARPDLAYATVLRQLQVMHTKGLLTRDESSRAHVYAPAQAQDSLQTNLLKDLIRKAFSGSGKDWCWPPCAAT